MTEHEKKELNSQLNEALIQLIQAQKWLRRGEYQGSSKFIGNVKELLLTVEQKLSNQPH